MSGDRPPPASVLGGSFAEPFDPPRAEEPSRLERLRALQRNERHLELRRIELKVEAAELERRIAEIAEDAPQRLQGPVEAIRFAGIVRAKAQVQITARATDQRLRRLRLEIAIATGAVARTLRPR